MKIKLTTMNKAAASRYNLNKGNYFMVCAEYRNLSNSQDFCEYINKDLSIRMRNIIDRKINNLAEEKYVLIDTAE